LYVAEGIAQPVGPIQRGHRNPLRGRGYGLVHLCAGTTTTNHANHILFRLPNELCML